jgi:transposase
MAKAYSYDLRQKVINAIELDGMKKSEAAQVFQLSRNTIDLWLKRQAEFAQFAKKYGDKTQAQMAALWEGEISARTLSRALQKIGWTRKKRHTAIANGMKPNAPPF